MCRKNLIIISAMLLTIACQKKAPVQHNYIVFYKPYTGEAENNFFSKDSLTHNIKRQYANLKNANVKADFDRAISRKDLRCVGISGFSYLIPGLDGYVVGKKGDSAFYSVLPQFEKMVEKDNFKVVDGTSDVINPGAPDVQIVARIYAEKYNSLMKDYIHDHHTGGK